MLKPIKSSRPPKPMGRPRVHTDITPAAVKALRAVYPRLTWEQVAEKLGCSRAQCIRILARGEADRDRDRASGVNSERNKG